MNSNLLFASLLIFSSFAVLGVASFVGVAVVPPRAAVSSIGRLNPPLSPSPRPSTSSRTTTTTTTIAPSRRPTQLNVLLDVPDQFFTFTFPVLGILLSISKNYSRVALEEAAWEQRLAEGREARLAQDPTLTELDLRRQEAANEWSAYGVPRQQEEAARRRRQEEEEAGFSSRRQRRRVRVLDRDDDDEDDDNVNYDDDNRKSSDPRDYRMTDEEIESFEREYGIEYDAYYDEPYALDELPEGDYDVDRLYGDRIYRETGEIFYRDASTGLFWRQGSKPRNLSFFG